MDVDLLPGERWWGGAVADGTAMPFGTSVHRRDLNAMPASWTTRSNGANQAAPLLISDRGRYVWSDWPFVFEFASGPSRGARARCDAGCGRRANLGRRVPGSGRRTLPAVRAHPALPMFTGPQYNTWMEMPYAPTQDGVLEYVRGPAECGVPAGRGDDRRPLVAGLWNLALRPLGLSGSRGWLRGCTRRGAR